MTDPAGPDARGRYRLTRWALRLWLGGQAGLTVTQPILAGLYLSGNLDAISLHSTIGGSLSAVAFVSVLLAVLHWALGRGPAWPVAATALLSVLAVVQATAGYSRTLGLHVPLGVAVVGISVGLLGWSVFAPERLRPRRIVTAPQEAEVGA